jgi:hypothetical protein
MEPGARKAALGSIENFRPAVGLPLVLCLSLGHVVPLE